jgi:FlaA1/EpsC-like NDP-sugar epimerase
MKARRWITGVQVRGTLEHLEPTMRKYAIDEVVLSSPSINGKVEQRIREVCRDRDCPVRRLHMEIA